MAGTGKAGDYTIGLMYSIAHRFWTVTGTETNRVEVEDDDDIHLMATVWDEKTGTVLPVGAGLSIELERDGELITQKPPWPMISQTMGFHYGDNFALKGDGAYTAKISLGGMDVPRFGGFEDKFSDAATVDIEFEFSEEKRDELSFELLDDREGELGTLDLMPMDMVPLSVVPSRDSIPGRLHSSGTTGDARFVLSVIENEPFGAVDGAYLVVSPRTPYNRIPLPMMSLSVTVERGGVTVSEGPLKKAIEPTVGYHYGMSVDDFAAGDSVTVVCDSPPQVSRHEGYETAFIEMSEAEVTLGE